MMFLAIAVILVVVSLWGIPFIMLITDKRASTVEKTIWLLVMVPTSWVGWWWYLDYRLGRDRKP